MRLLLLPHPQNSGICQEVLAACYITGVHHVYQVGGAQSIAAPTMARKL